MSKPLSKLYSAPTRKPVNTLTDEQLNIAAKRSGIVLVSKVSLRIKAITAGYLMIFRQIKTAENKAELKSRIVKFQKAANELRRIAGVTGNELMSNIVVKNSSTSIKLVEPPKRIRNYGDVQRLLKYKLPQRDRAPNYPFEILRHSLETCVAVTCWFSQEIEKPEFKATKEMARDFWILSIRNCMREFGLPSKVQKGQRAEHDYKPSPFVVFIYELMRQLPAGSMRLPNSKIATASVISRADKKGVDLNNFVLRFTWPEVSAALFLLLQKTK